MACPDDHPDDKHGKDNCRAWDPKREAIWALWHWRDTEVGDLRCMHASPLPKAIWLPNKTKI